MSQVVDKLKVELKEAQPILEEQSVKVGEKVKLLEVASKKAA